MDRTPDPVDETSPLTTEEYEGIQAAVSAGAGRRAGGQSCTLNSLLAEWSGVVKGMQEGYSWCAQELANDLWCRSALGRVWPLLPPRVQAIRGPELDRIDDRFRAATIAWPDREEEPGQWWMWRIPRVLEAAPGEPRWQGWPMGWDVMPFPKPETVEVVE